jgi:DNA-binding transcriptional LysR family regulator
MLPGGINPDHSGYPLTRKSSFTGQPVMINLKQLQAFVWVADLQSFRRAAERLNTTQPNISARIAALENELNVVLMERDAGSVRLTTKGAEMLSHARTVLRACDELVNASGNAALNDGILKIGVTEIIVNSWLREFLNVLKQAHPNISVELTVDVSVNLTKELLARTIDLAFQNGPFDPQTTGYEDLGTYPLVWVASPELGVPDSQPLTVQEMGQFPILTHARGTQPFTQVAQHFGASRIRDVRIVPSSSLAACLHMTIDAMGIASLPMAMVHRELASGRLRQLDYAWSPQALHFLARYDEQRSPEFVRQAALLAKSVAAGFRAGGK